MKQEKNEVNATKRILQDILNPMELNDIVREIDSHNYNAELMMQHLLVRAIDMESRLTAIAVGLSPASLYVQTYGKKQSTPENVVELINTCGKIAMQSQY